MMRHFLALTFVALIPAFGHGDDLNDICKESPDLCTGMLAPSKATAAAPKPQRQTPKAASKRELSTNQVMSTNTKTVKRNAAASKSGRRRLDELSTTQDNWDDLQSENAIYEKPAPPPPRSPGPPPPMRRQAATATPSRGPASIPSAYAAPTAAMIPPPSKAPPARPTNMTFESYMMENAANPAMGMKIADHQKAFADLSRPAVITIPGAEPEPVPAPTNSTNANSSPTGQTINVPGVGAVQIPGGVPAVTTPTDGGSNPSGGSSSSGAGLPIR